MFDRCAPFAGLPKADDRPQLKHIPKVSHLFYDFKSPYKYECNRGDFQDEILMAFGIDDSCFVEEAEFTPEESKCCFGANSRAACMDS